MKTLRITLRARHDEHRVSWLIDSHERLTRPTKRALSCVPTALNFIEVTMPSGYGLRESAFARVFWQGMGSNQDASLHADAVIKCRCKWITWNTTDQHTPHF
jgi:hypothetical protein